MKQLALNKHHCLCQYATLAQVLADDAEFSTACGWNWSGLAEKALHSTDSVIHVVKVLDGP